MATSRINIRNKFENGDIPSQNDFGEIFDSFVHKDEDKANIQMVETGTDDQHYVTPALLRAGLQNVSTITGNCYFPLKENFDNFNGTTIFLKKSPINFSVQAFKNGQLLLEGADYTLNYDTAILTFSSPITNRNIEVDYWYKNLSATSGSESDSGTTIERRPYRVYTALLTQSGTSAPVATVLENTLGGTVVWSRNAVGQYSATLAGAFINDKTTVLLTDSFLTTKYLRGSRQDNNVVRVYSTAMTTGTLSDAIEPATIEIRVYSPEIGIPTAPRGKFISTWRTNNSSDYQITLPLISSGTYDMTVDWGDGKTSIINSYNSPEVTHTYAVAGTYTVSISGVCTGWKFDGSNDKSKILSISQWGILKLGTTEGGYFRGCENLDLSKVTDTLDLTGTTSLEYAFESCFEMTTINRCNEWIVNSVTDMGCMFRFSDKFNQNISSWNTSNVTTMSGMFFTAKLFNQPIGDWNTSKVNDMSQMFTYTEKFNQPIGKWITSNVTDMSMMFSGATAFNQPIGNWNTQSAINMSSMFYNATAFNQPLGNWDVTNVNDFFYFMDDKTPTTFSSANLDSIYNGWSSKYVNKLKDISFGTAKYSSSSATGRAKLTGQPNNWSITDGGMI
ncbi:BspA family leucine-rich repeat surface protein [Flavobacterium sp. AJR]|uniref:BspA family leucine-rich repeat surface protein n=1 Tax=Flavobacterium sp. AJR TaxID=1979369 RepID=UPI000A3D8591|nr:BspA family leucine-rich repeat surface protein [Flavobacterium sp. AJR]OUL63702.1 hypothetical protein B8T70_03680 [Flavobacterium sp. AJR]